MPLTPRHVYVDTPAGQMHATVCGDGLPVVFMHWVPLSGRMYELELNPLAERGYKAVALDLMGFGRSAPRSEPWPADKHAAVVTAALKALNCQTCAVLGAHFSAPIGVELAAAKDLDVQALLLDGAIAFLPKEAGEAIAAKSKKGVGPGVHPDGSHETFLWGQAMNALTIFDPDFELTEKTIPLVYRFIQDYISTGMPEDFGAWLPFDMPGRLSEVTAPICVITAETDPLEPGYEPTLKAIPAATGVRIAGAHPLHNPDRAGEYATVIADFLDQAVSL